MSDPRTFFDTILKPSYDAWMADPLVTWTAKAATSNADTMAERLFKYWNGKDQAQIAGKATARVQGPFAA